MVAAVSQKKSYGPFFRKVLLFAFFFILIFSVTFGILYALGLVPNELGQTNDFSSIDPNQVATSTPIAGQIAVVQGEEPLRISIPSIGVDSPIRNPDSTNIDSLDNELTKGVVHYPGSGLAGKGNMLLFGHGSNLAVVNNKAYKVFTEIKTLQKGDLITIITAKKDYVYSVRKVTLAVADKVLVEFDTAHTLLTLSTCNTFGGHEDRYIVEADFVSSAER